MQGHRHVDAKILRTNHPNISPKFRYKKESLTTILMISNHTYQALSISYSDSEDEGEEGLYVEGEGVRYVIISH